MPVLHLTLNRICPDKLPERLAETVGEILQLPASTVLVSCVQALLHLDGSRRPAAFAQLISPVPLTAAQARAFDAALATILGELLDISAERLRTRIEAGLLPPPAMTIVGPQEETIAHRDRRG